MSVARLRYQWSEPRDSLYRDVREAYVKSAPESADVVDCFCVEAYVPDRFLRLALEMKAPGRGWLEFEVSPNGDGSSIRQTAIFALKGVLGRLYWYAESPFHHFLLPGLLRRIAGRAGASDVATMPGGSRSFDG